MSCFRYAQDTKKPLSRQEDFQFTFIEILYQTAMAYLFC